MEAEMSSLVGTTKSIVTALAASAFFASTAIAADTETAVTSTVTVTVSAHCGGGFGDLPYSYSPTTLPLAKAIAVPSAGTIIVQYVSGTWFGGSGGGFASGPNGTSIQLRYGEMLPLQEAAGVTGTFTLNLMALMGAFVPAAEVSTVGFQAVDQTKIRGAGISPSDLFFVGSRKVFRVSGAGTLFLGANDRGPQDNSGSLSVSVTFVP
jgi:hypothetical protein